jgi:hypothetical protein
MRTALTLEPEVAQQIRRRMARRMSTLKQVVNEALRASLSATEKEHDVRFKVEPHAFQFKPGIGPGADEFLKKMSR